MNCLICVGFLFLSAVGTSAWTAVEQTNNNQDHEGYCFSKIKGVGTMKKWEVKMKGTDCVRVECKEGGLMVFTGCDNVYCSTRFNLTAFYPDCCIKKC